MSDAIPDDIIFHGCWLNRRKHGDSVRTSPRLIECQYISLQRSCFHPMLPESLPEERNSRGAMVFRGPEIGVHFLPEDRESITSVRLRAYRNDMHAKLDYGLRLAAGLDIKQDIKAALKQFLSVFHGPYPNAARSCAASLACACCQYDWETSSTDSEVQTLGFHMANESLKLGLFSLPAFFVVNFMMMKAPASEIRLITSLYPRLVATYFEMTNGVGSQIGLARQCAACGRRSKHRSGFKTCSGPCKELKKPVYCDRECQKSDWQNHRRWCAAQSTADGVQMDPVSDQP